MLTHALWRHRQNGAYYLVQRSTSGKLTGAAGPIAPQAAPVSAERMYALLLQRLVSNPKVLRQLESKQGHFTEEYELDEQGHLWDFHEPARPRRR